jgi:hypothetical protein
VATKNYLDVEDLEVYKMLCQLHIEVYIEFRGRYKECIRMLNGLEKTLERKLPDRERRWQVKEGSAMYGSIDEPHFQGRPIE